MDFWRSFLRTIGDTHPLYEKIWNNIQISKINIKHTFEEINVVAVQYAMSIILHKRRIENNEPLPRDTQPP